MARWRKSFPLLTTLMLLAAPVCPATAQDDEDHTPPSRVLSMTVTQWNADFARRHGGQETEASDRESLRLYADCLRGRNDAHLCRLPVPARARLTRLRAACHALSNDALSLSWLYNGGGTMYIEIYASADVDDEAFFWPLIRAAPAAERPLTRTQRQQVAARLARLAALVRTADPARRRGELADVAPIVPEAARSARAGYAALRADLAALRGALAQAPAPEALAASRYVAHALPDRLEPIKD